MNIKFLNVVNITYPMLENTGNHINIDSNIVEVLNFLKEMNETSFQKSIEFFDEHKEQMLCFIQNMSLLTTKSEMTTDSKLFQNFKEQYDIFLKTKHMISEFKEIYDSLIPSIKTELVSESKELNKLVAFSSIDLSQKSYYKNEHNIDSLLELSKKGGNFLFFNRAGRNSTISEKRLSSLSTDGKSILKEKRNSMPLFLNDRDMMIFDDFLEIEKLNDALFKALRELLSEKIDLFNNKYNTNSEMFVQMITMIKTKYIELDLMFEQLSSNLKKFEMKITVENWYSALSEMFENCMEYIENEFNKYDKLNDSELPEKVMIINKHISLYNNLLDISWNDHLYDKVKVLKNALQIAWSKAKNKHNFVDKPYILNMDKLEQNISKGEGRPKAVVVANNDAKDTKSRIPKENLSRAEKRKSFGAALFQRMNLRASFIEEFDGLDINETSEPYEVEAKTCEIDEVEELSFDTPQNILQPKVLDLLSPFDQTAEQLDFSIHNISIDSFNEFGDSTLNDISTLGTNINPLVVKSETVFAISNKETKIPVRDLTVLQNKDNYDIDLSHIQLKNLEKSLDKKRAGFICSLVKTYCNEGIKVKNKFINCKPINM